GRDSRVLVWPAPAHGAIRGEGRGTAEVDGADVAGFGSAAGLALAQQLPEEYVSEARTMASLPSARGSHHDQVDGCGHGEAGRACLDRPRTTPANDDVLIADDTAGAGR